MNIDYDALREDRKKRTIVECNKTKSYMYGSECELRVSNNGYQYTCISMNTDEVKLAIVALQKYVDENESK